MPGTQYWLVKSEPSVFSFDDFLATPKKTTNWDGIRNYAARNHLQAMKKGDVVYFYHSSAVPSEIVGVAEVVREAYPDPTAFDSKHDNFDPKSKEDSPTWFMVDLKAVRKLKRSLTLDELKKTKGLDQMALIRIGRLSVQPVTEKEHAILEKLEQKA
jgi:predicted RNA-binding protein with PUA-like domain